MSQGNYSEEFKEHILSEHEAGVSGRELARRYEPSATTIQNLKRQAKAKASESEPGESVVAQLRRLQRRNQELEQENAFLKKRQPGLPPTAGFSVVEPGVRINRSGEEELCDPFDVSGIRDFRIRLLCVAKPQAESAIASQ